ncbi:Rieske (2Fe-2S) protein [Halopseudomonas xiamenensis]|uniref:Rieske (2Fe-2S) protein n=1 Tax=Halopseudomonas xiamenensis TaxID=157792 RepID=UPI0016292D70|nr:Rieske 2Fe-2S domain-containing protein [Halopseudomonas xiamenensis]
MDNFHHVMNAGDLEPGQSRAVEIEGVSVLVCNVKGEYLAVENRCTHQNSALEGGRIRNGMIACPLHGVLFDLRSGCGRGPLGKVPLRTFDIKLVGDEIHVGKSAAATADA